MSILSKNILPFIKGYALQNYLTAEEGIVHAFNNDYQYWYIDGSIISEAPSNWSHERIDNLQKMITHFGVKPIFHGNFKLPLASDIDELRLAAVNYVKKEIDIAAKINAPLIIHGGCIVEPREVRYAKKVALHNFSESIKTLLDYSQKKDVTLFAENLANYKKYHPFFYIFTATEEFDLILSSCDIKLFLDIGHANIGNASIKNIFQKFHRNIAGMSFSNNNGQYDQHLSLFRGNINYQEIISSIIESNWSGIIAFETRDVCPKQNVADLTEIYMAAYGLKNCAKHRCSPEA